MNNSEKAHISWTVQVFTELKYIFNANVDSVFQNVDGGCCS